MKMIRKSAKSEFKNFLGKHVFSAKAKMLIGLEHFAVLQHRARAF